MTGKKKVTVDGEELEVKIEDRGDFWEVTVDGTKFSITANEIPVTKKRKKSVKSVKGGSGTGIVSSSIPGKIVAINVLEGDNVAIGDALLVLEAMKMQNEIRSPTDGVVGSVVCQTGQRVEANSPLLEILPKEGGS